MKTNNLYISVSIILLSFSAAIYSQTPQWTVQHAGLPASQNPTLFLSAVDSNVCWGVQGSIWVPVVNPKVVLTTNGGVNWSVMDITGISGSLLQPTSIFGMDANTAYITIKDSTLTTSGGIFKTSDGGKNWTKQSTAFSGAGASPVRVYFFDANNGLAFGQPNDSYWEIYTTTDGGTNWIRVPSANIPAPDLNPNDADLAGPGTASGNSFWFSSGTCSVYHTTDRGLNWSVTRNIYSAPAYYIEVGFKDTVNGIGVSYFGDDTNKDVTSTTDGGASWTMISGPPSTPSFGEITYVPGTSGTYFVTSQKNIGYPEPTVSGSMYTPDAGHTWNRVDNLSHGRAAFISNKIGWSPGCGDTIFKWSEYPLDISSPKPLNNTLSLSQNYPNPFSSSTSIQFRIPSSSKVSLKVFDIQGSEVATLVNEEKSAGSYKVKFESNGLSSGIYYYRLQVGESMETKKLCVVQ